MTRAENRKYHVVYRITNVLNGNFYVGVHSTDDLDDGYMGSGKRIRYSLNKYGAENHLFEVLEYCSSRKEMFLREEQLVNEEFLQNPLCMNIATGGKGGFHDSNGCWLGKPNYHKFAEKYANDDEFRTAMKKSWSAAKRKQYELHGLPEKFADGSSFRGRTHSEETKSRMSESHKGKHDGESNSQFGTCWIHNVELKCSKKISKSDLMIWLEDGWLSGRKLKFE